MGQGKKTHNICDIMLGGGLCFSKKVELPDGWATMSCNMMEIGYILVQIASGGKRLARVSELKTWICMEGLDRAPLSLLEDTGPQKKLSDPRCIQIIKLLGGISRSKRKKCERFMPKQFR